MASSDIVRMRTKSVSRALRDKGVAKLRTPGVGTTDTSPRGGVAIGE